MAAIHDLLDQVQDDALRERLQKEIEKMTKTKKFGLVFEDHTYSWVHSAIWHYCGKIGLTN